MAEREYFQSESNRGKDVEQVFPANHERDVEHTKMIEGLELPPDVTKHLAAINASPEECTKAAAAHAEGKEYVSPRGIVFGFSKAE